MKNKLLALGTLSLGWILMMSSSIDVVAKRGDRTGSPVQTGSSQCGGSCHNGGSMDAPTISVTLLDASSAVVTEYVPEDTYTIKTEIVSNAAGYGFETVALLNNNDNAGTSAAKSANVQIETKSSRSYSSHKGGSSATGVFETTWVAPAAGFSDVTFYASGNAVNNNFDNTGDLATAPTSLEITEKGGITGGTGEGPVSINENKESTITIYPNPVSNDLIISNIIIQNVTVFDLSGKEVISSNKNKLNVSMLVAGIYVVKIIDLEGNESISKIVKQ